MDTIESLDEKIYNIKMGIEYKSLVIKHRGPLEDRRLRELNMRIDAFETQKRGLAPNPQVVKGLQNASGAPPKPHVIKAVGKANLGNIVNVNKNVGDGKNVPAVKIAKLTPLAVVKPISITPMGAYAVKSTISNADGSESGVGSGTMNKIIKPKLPAAAHKGMAPETISFVTKTSHDYSTLGKTGKPDSFGSLKAAPMRGSMSKPMIFDPQSQTSQTLQTLQIANTKPKLEEVMATIAFATERPPIVSQSPVANLNQVGKMNNLIGTVKAKSAGTDAAPAKLTKLVVAPVDITPPPDLSGENLNLDDLDLTHSDDDLLADDLSDDYVSDDGEEI
jgi:hypothetical protein